MEILLGSRRNYYVTRVGVLLVIVILIVGTIGCAQPAQYSLTISSTDGGDSTCVPAAGCTCGEGTESSDGLTVPEECICAEGTEVIIEATPKLGYRFVNWTGDVDEIADVEDASTTITMNDDYSITANFVKQYDLTISSTTGGSVTMPGEGTYAYDEGEVVNLVAQAEGGYHFVNWTGDVSTIANVNATATTITMSSNYIITANFTVDLYFRTDVCLALNGPATRPPEIRNPSVVLQIMTNIVTDSVQVDLPNGRSVIIPRHTGVFTPEVDWITLFRFVTDEPGMAVAGGDYIFTGLDVTGEPISEARNIDIWVGVEPPDPPTNVRAELTEDGILVSWDESPIIPGSFEPTAEPQLGFYQVEIYRIETGELVYGVNFVSVSSYLIPQDKADFTGKDHGLSLSEMEDGTYCIHTSTHSMAPKDSLGKGHEYNSSDSGQSIIFTIQDGEITIE